jgi:hypothetical protein
VGRAVSTVLAGLPRAPSQRLRSIITLKRQMTTRLDAILDLLNRHHQRATYGAVAGMLGVMPRSVMQGREKNKRHSWIVNQDTGLPTDYHDFLMHPALLEGDEVLRTVEELVEWVAARS